MSSLRSQPLPVGPGRRPPPSRKAALCLLAVGVLVLMILGSAMAGSSTEVNVDVTVVAEPRWGDAQAGSWAPYLVTVRNEGGVDVEGEVVLTPQPEPPPLPGAKPVEPTTSSTAPTFLAVEDRIVTATPPRSGLRSTTDPPWPTYRAPVSVPSGSEKTLTVMVLQAEFGFGVEVVDDSGVLARAAGPMPSGKERVAVLLLSDVAGADTTVEALPQAVAPAVAPGLDVIQLRAARDFPDEALHLAGLDAVIIDDFNTATLSDRQRRAIQDYVSLGGSLVLAGGAAWSRTLGSLPPGLAPLRASGSMPVSLNPLADLLVGTTATVAEVATGEVVSDRVALAAPGGPPLVLEKDYRAGRVSRSPTTRWLSPSAQTCPSQAWHGTWHLGAWQTVGATASTQAPRSLRRCPRTRCGPSSSITGPGHRGLGGGWSWSESTPWPSGLGSSWWPADLGPH